MREDRIGVVSRERQYRSGRHCLWGMDGRNEKEEKVVERSDRFRSAVMGGTETETSEEHGEAD